MSYGVAEAWADITTVIAADRRLAGDTLAAFLTAHEAEASRCAVAPVSLLLHGRALQAPIAAACAQCPRRRARARIYGRVCFPEGAVVPCSRCTVP